jgi:RNA polymerase sigma-70 factor (ECF subfamily)
MHEDRLQLNRQLIECLPEKQRTVMQLRETEGKSYKDIAEVMNITEEQVKISLFRARQTIKQRYIDANRYGL